MKRGWMLAAALCLLAACAQAVSQTPERAPAPAVEAGTAPAQAGASAPVAPVAAAAPTWPSAPRELSLSCAGAFVQGGIALCRTLPGARLTVGGRDRGAADDEGWAVIGFDRFATGQVSVEARAGGASVREAYPIAARTFSVQRVNGLPPQTVTPTEPDVLRRIERDRQLKNVGFSSRAALRGWLDGFQTPTTGRQSSSWGNQRILNGVPRTPHYGVDIAAPEGTPIRAPASGVVTLAEPDMHFEGGLVLIDHGQGLISMYLHMSRLDVRAGDHVTQGQTLGAVGARGRATGPHLCWRLRWRDQNLDPSVAIEGLARARTELGGGAR